MSDEEKRESSLSAPPSEASSKPGNEDLSNHTSAPSSIPSSPSPPPNGGTTAWLHALGSFFLLFNTWGILNAFGVYQTYYESGALFTESSSNISWIGSIQAFMLLMTGVFAGPVYDRGYLKTLLVMGAFLVVFGHMMLSLCTEYWQVLLAQAFTVGIGTGLMFVPAFAILQQYFTTRMGLAIGIAASGSSFGGIIYPIVLYRLVDTIGFPWAVRVEGFIALATLTIPIAVLKFRVKPGRVRAMFDWSAFLDVPYMFFVISTLISFMGLVVVLFYLSYYSEATQITNTQMAFYLIPIYNAASCFGRTLPNAWADTTGPFNLLAPGTFIAGILMLITMGVHTEAGVVIIAILIGFVSGVLIGMPPLCFVAVTKDKSKLGTRMGMGYAMVGFGVLAGGPGAGAILGQGESLNWIGVWAFGGASCCVAGLMYFAQRVSMVGWKLKKV
jgi:MFS family permease